MHVIALALIVAAAGVSPGASPGGLASAALAALEARAPAENSYPHLSAAFQREVIQLIESNRLVTGEDFYRAAGLCPAVMSHYRDVRVRYELLLAAVAKGEPRAAASLPMFWNELMRRIGRSARFEISGQPEFDPDDPPPLDLAPACVAAVILHPEEARTKAAAAQENPEMRQIVAADQAPRSHWEKLTLAEQRQLMIDDHRRNVRTREIVRTGALHTAQDFANAALVLQHSSRFDGYQMAHELAVCSLLLGDRGLGRWLVAATYDRMLNSVGLDQRFGTQGESAAEPGAKPTLTVTDETGICDNERLALGCPTLAAKRANFYAARPKG